MKTKDVVKCREAPEAGEPSRTAPARLKSRMRAFVGLIICAYSIYSLALIYQISNPPAASEDPSLSASAGDSRNAAIEPVPARRIRGWVAAGFLLTAVVLGATFFYTRKLLEPLEEIRLNVRHIALGRLDRSLAVRENDEVGAIAACVNEIAANQQEILLHLWNQTGHSIELIDRIAAGVVNACPNDGLMRIKRDLSSVRDSMAGLRALAGDVDFYQVNLRKGKVCAAGNHPGTVRRNSD